jgi:methylated-DNA-[protein]-cysteine S-methyltransferase
LTVSPDLDTRFRSAALDTGLVDVRYDLVDSPVGTLFVAETPRGLCRISYTLEGQDEQVARIFGVRVLRVPLDDVRRELDEYFGGRRRSFDLPLDLRVAPFHEAVLHELARVPYGRLDTYGSLAAKVGRPRAARAVGSVMNRNPIPIVLPCHRIVGANGSLTGYAGGLHVKRALLELEGATLAV